MQSNGNRFCLFLFFLFRLRLFLLVLITYNVGSLKQSGPKAPRYMHFLCLVLSVRFLPISCLEFPCVINRPDRTSRRGALTHSRCRGPLFSGTSYIWLNTYRVLPHKTGEKKYCREFMCLASAPVKIVFFEVFGSAGRY